MGRRVAERARIISDANGADLALIHVLEPVNEALIEPGLARMMREYQTTEATALAEWVRERSTSPVTLEVVKGSPAWELSERGNGASLVVVGSSSIDAFGVGPVARRVARKARADTLVVRRQPRVPYRKIVAAVDFSEPSRTAIHRSLEMFPDVEVTALFSLPSRFDPVLSAAGLYREELEVSRASRLRLAEERMEEFTAPWNGTVRTLVVDGPPTETIEEIVRRRGADLVVVASRGASATRMVLLGTIAEGLVGRAPCDVLVARVKAQFRRP